MSIMDVNGKKKKFQKIVQTGLRKIMRKSGFIEFL